MQAASSVSHSACMHPKSPPHMGSALIAQVRNWSTKNCTLAHPCETQFEMQAMLKLGGNDEVSMHWSAQPTTSRHPSGWH